MRHYSFIVMSPREVPLPEYRLFLASGRNVFNVFLTDPDVFRGTLAAVGATILQENSLDEFEVVPDDVVEAKTPPWDEV